jgi:hypothetical protein
VGTQTGRRTGGERWERSRQNGGRRRAQGDDTRELMGRPAVGRKGLTRLKEATLSAKKRVGMEGCVCQPQKKTVNREERKSQANQLTQKPAFGAFPQGPIARCMVPAHARLKKELRWGQGAGHEPGSVGVNNRENGVDLVISWIGGRWPTLFRLYSLCVYSPCTVRLTMHNCLEVLQVVPILRVL